MTQDQALYADLRQLRAWFRNTGPGGGRVIYAVGAGPDPEHEVVRQVNAWRRAGDVVTVQQRVNGRLHYLVERSRRDKGRAATIAPDMAETVEGRMFAAIDRAAQKGMPCPSYTDLADALGLRDKQAAAHRFRKLVSAGLISVRDIGGRRVVTIVETGASTASGVAAP
ncbi:hypothetical protein FHW96_000212 [Novosphingobium sp. SG751A]|uniref:winged helix-turn-helix domain-containing protein n=1 Tax=Novosphingobium sp. SG751A TaxID=2587000 RepID=UPI001556EEC6|nr:winged helix-turn-helix domain-containing protein [Novosphingobium sp. SG751A]NOW44085.1 hypothetical protein [Novosphingobium sp. SG751A]